MALPLDDPTAEDLREAFELCRARNWPDNYDEAMADPTRARLVRLCARGRLRRMQARGVMAAAPLPQTQLLPAWPPRRTKSLPQIDHKRAAAGDRDD